MRVGIRRKHFLKKVIYIIGIVIVSVIGIIGAIGSSYFEVGGGDKILAKYWFLISILSLMIGGAFYYYFPKVFPKGYSNQKRVGRIFLPIAFLCISFVLMINIFKFINANFGYQHSFIISGICEKRYSKRGKKGNRSYYLGFREFNAGKYYEFHVKKKVYQEFSMIGDTISKVFFKGSLGVVYRNSW